MAGVIGRRRKCEMVGRLGILPVARGPAAADFVAVVVE